MVVAGQDRVPGQGVQERRRRRQPLGHLDLRSETGERWRETTFGRSPAWSPDGSAIAFLSGTSLWIDDPAASPTELVAAGSGLRNPPRWSPCGDFIVYASTQGAPYDFALWICDPGTGSTKPIHPGVGGERGPVWFAGCDSILYHHLALNERDEIVTDFFAMTGAGLDSRLILHTDQDARSPDLSPDAGFLSFHVPDRVWGFRIAIFDRGSGEYVRGPAGSGREASWSPDGRRIVYVCPAPGFHHEINARLMVFDLDTGASTPLF